MLISNFNLQWVLLSAWYRSQLLDLLVLGMLSTLGHSPIAFVKIFINVFFNLQFQVYQEFSQATDRCTTIKLRLYHVPSRRYRSVWYLQYADWAEQNCPRDVNHFLGFLEELSSVRLASTQEVPPGHNTNPPVLLHCMEGGGRSGVTLTADLLFYTLNHNEDLDISRVVGQLRHQRDSIIPSLAQYKFIYNLLISYLKRSRLI
ncbi:tyrosine-protein phosphatase non-receptor type 21-like [Drosophila suzukii]|uniref:Tyrosine-protein phosphatase non-receptor type 21-like n=1 Tax=Drosophila suzukii TaxID=28584 RepID=A0ABM4TWZ4_DROSZ